MTSHEDGDSLPPAQDRTEFLNMLSVVYECLLAADLPEAAEHVSAAKRTIERKD
jgi:hypothetical protein